MENVLSAVGAAFAMFSALPVKSPDFEDRNLRFLLAAFPLIGIVIGLLEVGWFWLSFVFCFPQILTAAGACALPVLLTGGIHLDGYMDVSDALSSWGDERKRREILTDPHIGAFAAIRLAVFLILYAGFASALSFQPAQMLLFACSFVLSRCLSALAVMVFPLSKDTGLTHMFQSAADRGKCTRLLLVQAIAAAIVMIAGGGILGGLRYFFSAFFMLCCAAGQWLYLRKTAAEKFGGLSGDLNGWFLEKAGLWMLAALALTS